MSAACCDWLCRLDEDEKKKKQRKQNMDPQSGRSCSYCTISVYVVSQNLHGWDNVPVLERDPMLAIIVDVVQQKFQIGEHLGKQPKMELKKD